jgi:hypothetical protein
MERKSQLLHVVFALRSPSSFASLLNCRKKQSDKDRDDRDHNQQFDQCESTFPVHDCLLNKKGLRTIHWGRRFASGFEILLATAQRLSDLN